MAKEYLRKSEIIREYNLSYSTLERWDKAGIIHGINNILYTRKEIEAAINRPKQKPGPKPKNK